MSIGTVLTRIRDAVFGAPLTHGQAKARHEAAVAVQRGSAGGASAHDRGTSVQSQVGPSF